jgi:hypothetical protein
MRRRLAGVSERNWRVLDRLLVVALIAFGWVDLATNADLEGPLWLNLAVITAIALSSCGAALSLSSRCSPRRAVSP